MDINVKLVLKLPSDRRRPMFTGLPHLIVFTLVDSFYLDIVFLYSFFGAKGHSIGDYEL